LKLISGTSHSLHSAVLAGMGGYRHKVFIQKLGWQLQCEDGLEYDQFDRDNTFYVAATDDEGAVIGTARLLPTTRPYLLNTVFPQLMNGLDLPHSDDIWELSRFAAMDFGVARPTATCQFSSPVAVDLLSATLACAARLGAKRLVAVCPLGVERLLLLNGFRAERVGPPVLVDGNPLIACWIEVD